MGCNEGAEVIVVYMRIIKNKRQWLSELHPTHTVVVRYICRLSPQLLDYLRRISRCGFVGVSVSLGVDFKVQNSVASVMPSSRSPRKTN